MERSSLSKLTKPKCSWHRVNTTKYLKFIAIIFVFQNNAPFSKKTTNDEFCFVALTPQTNLRFLCTYCGFLPFSFFSLFLQTCYFQLTLPKRWLLIKQQEKKSSIKKWKTLYFRQMQETFLFSNNETFSMAKGSSKLCLCVSLIKTFKFSIRLHWWSFPKMHDALSTHVFTKSRSATILLFVE